MRGVYKRGGRYWICYAGPSGLVRESTGRRDAEDARAYREHRLREVEAGTWRPVTRRAAQKKRLADNVYFLADTLTQTVKIGTARDVLSRVRVIQLMSPVPLTLLGVIPRAGWDTEASLHRRFRSSRLHGEWFTLTPEIAQTIASSAQSLHSDSGVTVSSPKTRRFLMPGEGLEAARCTGDDPGFGAISTDSRRKEGP